MELSQFARDYLSLGLRINKHIEGYVEHYYGPPEIKVKINSELEISPKKLLVDCSNLIIRLPNQGYEARRENFLLKNLNAIETILQVLNGEKYQYLELVERLYDFKPIFYEDDFFFNLTAKANELYEGKGTLANRMSKYAEQRNIPKEIMKKSFINAISIAQQRTKEFFPSMLPENENVNVIETSNQSWQMYCWYHGDFNSIVEINTDRIQYWTSLLYNVCHEGYPGHHTERTVREKLLFRNKNYFECSILLIYTPEMVISEGIGVTAEDVLFDPYESALILFNDINPNLKIEEDVDTFIRQNEIRRGFRRFESNLAYHKYVHKWSNEEIMKFIKSLEIIPDNAIQGSLNFISNKIWAPYAQTYQGERLIKEKFGDRPTPDDFLKILKNQTLPTDLI